MGWSDPNAHVYATGEVVTAATLNTYVKDDLEMLTNSLQALDHGGTIDTGAPGRGSPNYFDESGSNIVTTNSVGGATIVFPTPFPYGLVTVVAVPGDNNIGPFIVMPVMGAGTNGVGFSFICYDLAGGLIATQPLRINWTARGF